MERDRRIDTERVIESEWEIALTGPGACLVERERVMDGEGMRPAGSGSGEDTPRFKATSFKCL